MKIIRAFCECKVLKPNLFAPSQLKQAEDFLAHKQARNLLANFARLELLSQSVLLKMKHV